jgi:hypothetical protein
MSCLVIAISRRKFPLGQIVITANAQGTLAPEDVQQGIARHSMGDWGDIDADDRRENEFSLKNGNRLMSVYRSGETVFWVITEADRSATTVLLPSDY